MPKSPLHADVQQWAVQWNDIQIDRPIGRGSFGWVRVGVLLLILPVSATITAGTTVRAADCGLFKLLCV
jgi:hypothetical protein